MTQINKREEIKIFRNELMEYLGIALNIILNNSSAQEQSRGAQLNMTIARKLGYLENLINGLCEPFPENMNKVWFSALRLPVSRNAHGLLVTCLQATNKAIGKLESDIERGARDKRGILKQKDKTLSTNTESPLTLFDKMQFHPRIVEVSKSCFVSGNYREAILNAFIELIDYVKGITRLDLDGDDLVNRVFSFNYDKDLRRITKYPIIRINELKTVSDRNEQQGFMFLCKGAAGGIRNPKAHKLVSQSNPLHTLEYLAFASLLMRRIEEGKLNLKETNS